VGAREHRKSAAPQGKKARVQSERTFSPARHAGNGETRYSERRTFSLFTMPPNAVNTQMRKSNPSVQCSIY